MSVLEPEGQLGGGANQQKRIQGACGVEVQREEPEVRAEKVTEYLKYEFDDREQTDNAKTLARKNRSLAEHELKKKQLASTLKQEEDDLKKEIAEYSRFVNDGYDFRLVDCRVLYDHPFEGRKSFVRIDNGEVVKETSMTSEEQQQSLSFAG